MDAHRIRPRPHGWRTFRHRYDRREGFHNRCLVIAKRELWSSVVSYDVRYILSDASGKVDPANWIVDVGAWTSGELSYVLAELEGGHHYDIQVRAVNGSGPGTWSSTATGSTATVAPGTPIHAFAGSRHRSVEVNWKPPAQDSGTTIIHYDLRFIRAADLH